MVTRRRFAAAGIAAGLDLQSRLKGSTPDRVSLVRVPDGGLQPQVVREGQRTHLLYYSGDPRGGDLYYVRSETMGGSFSPALRVNSQEGSAIAAGTIRGGQMAAGRDGRIHVAWNGSMKALPRGPLNPDSDKPGEPMLYSRLNDRRIGFEPQRNLMHHSFGLDGGGSVAADASGNVYVAWHGVGEAEAKSSNLEGEGRRAVWVTKSTDDGRSFSTEAKAWSRETGACGCCGMKLFADSRGSLFGLYRSATRSVHRDVYLLASSDHGSVFGGTLVHPWELNACPMSSMDLAEAEGVTVAAWETAGQVYWTRVGPGQVSQPVAAPGDGKGRKHPRVAVNRNGEVLLVWTEGTGWQKGGDFAWQLYDASGKIGRVSGRQPGIPAWSFAAVLANGADFTILY